MLAMVANSVAICKNRAARDEERERKLATVDSIGRATPGGGRKAQFGLLQ